MLSDLRFFFFHRPAIPTWIDVAKEERREEYSDRIRQRLAISVDEYAVLNIHRIGIEAPVGYVFEELLKWDADSTCWPNHLAAAERVDGRLEHIRVFLFGRKDLPFGIGQGRLFPSFLPLFDLRAVKVQHVPEPSGVDNARYILFACSGGYPIGFFALYVRSSIASQCEAEQTQAFLAVGFNFYGEKDWPHTRAIHWLWEAVHNRVTANILNRFKRLCEWRFRRVQAGS